MTEQKSDDLRMGALYIRVSTHEQDELSPDAQKRLLLDYAKSNGIVVQKDAVFVESVYWNCEEAKRIPANDCTGQISGTSL